MSDPFEADRRAEQFTSGMASLRDKIDAADAKLSACFNAGDFTGLVNLYTEDCRVMPSGLPAVTGREAVAKLFKGVYDSGFRKVKFDEEEIGSAGGDVVYSRGLYTFYLQDGSVADEGKFIVLWKLAGDGVLMYTDIFNSNK